MALIDKNLAALREREKKLRTLLEEDSRRLIRTWARLGLGLVAGGATYSLAYMLLGRRRKAQWKTSATTLLNHSKTDKKQEKGWLLRLFRSLLLLGLPKSSTHQLQKVLRPLLGRKESLPLSLLLTILPWFVRSLFVAYGQRRSRTSS